MVLAADFGTKVTFVFLRRFAWDTDFFVLFMITPYLAKVMPRICYN